MPGKGLSPYGPLPGGIAAPGCSNRLPAPARVPQGAEGKAERPASIREIPGPGPGQGFPPRPPVCLRRSPRGPLSTQGRSL